MMNNSIRKKLTALALLSTMTIGAQELVTENVFKDITIRKTVRDTRFSRPSPAGKLRKSGKPVAFYIGDSTMRTNTNGQGWNGMWGFGLFAQEWFDESKIVVENHALGGTSSRTFYNYEWPTVKKGIKKGDFVVISFGHNDGGELWEKRSTLSGTSATDTKVVTNDKGVKETIYTFGQYMRMYIDDVRALGATPILCSRTPRGNFTDGTLPIDKNYRHWGMTVAQEKGVAYIDLEGVANPIYNAFGEWKTTQLFEAGTLHTSLLGAWHNAYCATLAIAADPQNPLYPYLLDTTLPKLDIERQAGKSYTFKVGGDDTSARNEWRSGRWGLIYNTLEKGDTVMLAFGANELGSQTSDGELGCMRSADENRQFMQMKATSRWATVYSYGWYIHYFLNDIKEKGGIGILVCLDGKTPDQVTAWNKELAQKYGVELRHTSDISGIQAVKVATPEGIIYNLQGVPVTQPQKGIYIRNGKKIFLK